MIRLEIPAQVMLPVDGWCRGVYAQPPSRFWHRSKWTRDRAQTSGLTAIPTSLAALRPSSAYWVFEWSPACDLLSE